jgi:YbbR domain-containing protein
MSWASLRQDLGLKLAALFLSLLLWLYVQNTEQRKVDTSFTLPVSDASIVNKPDELIVVDMPRDVSVKLRGSTEAIENFVKQSRSRNLRAVVDASTAEEGANDFRVLIEPISELQGLDLDAPPTVTVVFEQKVEEERPVEVVTARTPPTGFEFGSAVVNPPTVKLIGARSRLGRVGSVRAVLDLNNIRPGASYPVDVEVLDKSGKPIPPESLERRPMRVEIVPALTPAQPRRSLLVSPRFQGQPAPGFNVAGVTVEPEEMVVQGDRSRISDLYFLETEPFSLEGLQKTTSRLLAVKVPPGIRLQSPKPVRVTVRIVATAPAPTPPPSLP